MIRDLTMKMIDLKVTNLASIIEKTGSMSQLIRIAFGSREFSTTILFLLKEWVNLKLMY